MERTPKKNSSRLQLVIAVMIMTALFLAELYVMINESNNVVLLVGIAVLILIALYFVVDAILDCTNEKDIANRELYDDIHRSEKASYMLMKKNLEEVSKQIRALENGKKEDNTAEIIKSQKAVAKVALSKTKETQDRLFIELNNLEASINDSIHGLSQKLSGFQEEIERLADHIARINEEAILAASKNMQEIRTIVSESPVVVPVAEPVIEEEPIVFEETFDDVLEDSFTEEILVEDSFAEDSVLEDLLAEPEVDVVSELDELDSLLTDIISDEEEPAEELDFGDLDLGSLDLDIAEDSPVESDDDILSQLLAAEEAPVVEEEIDVLAELTKAEEIPVVEPEPIPEPTPAPAPAPAPADNGGKMGQDDIAALIASMTGGDAAPAPEPTPAPTPAPAPAPAPADNGGKMNQDDIAALIASMTN